MKKTFKYRVKPNKDTATKTTEILNLCRIVYNLCIEQRRNAWKFHKQSISTYDQIKQLPEMKKAFPEFKQVPSQSLQDVVERVDKAFQSFFRRIKSGEKPGYPRFKGYDRYDSFTLKQAGWRIEGKYLHIKKIGKFKIKLHRPIVGDIKTVTISKTSTGKWYVCFCCDNVPSTPLPKTGKSVGMYYVDSHRIFRFVQGRDSFWRNHYKVTDEADPQWKQVLEDCSVDIIYALSPQAKGKIERPYGWLQDRIVRTCARENIRKIAQCRKVLKWEIDRYNNYQVHTTTGEIPSVRFNRALDEHRSLFRNFVIPPPYLSTKDIFCLRANRIVNSYRKISLNNLEIKLHGVRIGDTIDLRIVPNKNTGLAEVRLWCDKKFLKAVTIKNDDLNLVHF